MGTTAPVKLPTDRLGKLPRRVTVGIYLDDTLADVHDQATVALEAATARLESGRARRIAAGKTARGADLVALPDDDRIRLAGEAVAEVDAAIEAELAPLRAAVDAALVALDAGTKWFTFRALGRKKYAAMVKEHPPTDADHEAMVRDSGNPNAKATFNSVEMAPVLVRAAALVPALDARDIAAIFEGETWNEVEVQALFMTALSAQIQSRAVKHRPAPIVPVAVAS